MFPHMNHQLGAMHLLKPEILGQITMRRREIRRMKITDLIGVVATAGLNQHGHMTQQKTMHSKTLLLQIHGLFR